MAEDKPKLLLNDVLCYIYSALNDDRNTDSIVKACVPFYTEVQIKEAKSTLCSFNNERIVQRRGDNSVKSHLIDIISLIKKFQEENVETPVFVAGAYNSMPPGSEFECINGSISVLIDEIVYLKEEIKCLKDLNLKNDLCLDNISIKSDLIEIKNQLKNLNQDVFRNEARRRLSYTPALRNYNFQSDIVSPMDGSIQSPKEVGIDEWTKGRLSDSDVFKHLNTNDHDDDNSDSIDDVNDIIVNNSGKNLPSVEPSAPSLSQFSTRTDFGVEDDYECSNFLKCVENVSYAAKTKTEVTSKPITLKSKTSIDRSRVQYKPKVVVASSSHGSSKSTLRKDSDGFITVVSRSKRRQNIEGTRELDDGFLKCAKKMSDLYVGRCDVDIQPNTIVDYVKNEFKINVIECLELDTKIRFSKAFKLTVELNDRNKLLDLESWPKGIIVRKFYNRR